MNDMARRIMRDRRMSGDGRERYGDRDGHYGGYGEYEGEYRGTYERDHRDSEDMRRRDRGEDMRRRDRGEDSRRDREDSRRDRQDSRRDREGDYGMDREGDYRRDRGYRHERDMGGYSRNRYGEFTDRRRDYAEEGEEEENRLTKEDIKKWTRSLEGADGSRGEHFEKKQIADVAKTIGVKFDKYSHEELALVANMLYSDFCEALRNYIPRDVEKEAMAYTKMAQAWLEDPDAPEGSEKLALYYYCVIEEDE